MKFSNFRSGQVGLLLTASVLVTSCNQSEYFPTEEYILGSDSYCSYAKDLYTCQQMTECQAAFEPGEAEESEELIFAACIAIPTPIPVDEFDSDPVTDPIADTGGDTGGDTGTGTDPVIDDPADDEVAETTPEEDETTARNNRNKDKHKKAKEYRESGKSPDSSSGSGANPGSANTISDAYNSNCQKVAEEHLWIKKLVRKKKESIVSKVKICHLTGNGSSHTIVIACPALKAHMQHEEDYLGACAHPQE